MDDMEANIEIRDEDKKQPEKNLFLDFPRDVNITSTSLSFRADYYKKSRK